MMIKEIIGKILAGERDGTTLWKIAVNEIEYPPITDPADGVAVAALAENILRCGQLQPVLLRRITGKASGQYRYSLIAGRRRIEAMRMLGHTHVSAIVVSCDSERVDVLSLSENFLRREANFWEFAERAKKLMEHGMEIDRLASLLAMPVGRLHVLAKILELPEEELRWMKMARVTQKDAERLLELPAIVRQAILEKNYVSPELGIGELIDEWDREPDPRTKQLQKICVGDVRLFVNTLERSVETMRSAGYDVKIERSDDIDSCNFSLRVAKRAGVALKESKNKDVSRETSSKSSKRRKISSALSIFEAIAEDECAVHENVSRETLREKSRKSEEIAEKLELCIDCPTKKCYNE